MKRVIPTIYYYEINFGDICIYTIHNFYNKYIDFSGTLTFFSLTVFNRLFCSVATDRKVPKFFSSSTYIVVIKDFQSQQQSEM